MPYEIPWEDSYWESRREAYDDGDPWSIKVFDDDEEEEEDEDAL